MNPHDHSCIHELDRLDRQRQVSIRGSIQTMREEDCKLVPTGYALKDRLG